MAMPVIKECDSPPCLKAKLKPSFCCSPVMEMINRHEMLHQHYDQEGNKCRNLQPRTPRSPYAWLKSTAHDLEIKDRCCGLIGKRGKKSKRHSSEDFRYDPQSYSLNFEDDVQKEDELPLNNNFKARLHVTRERLVVVVPPVKRAEASVVELIF